MKTTIQGQTSKFRVLFYDKEPAQGGVLIDPDNTFHTWQIMGDFEFYVYRIDIFENGSFPISQTEFWFAVENDPVLKTFKVNGYLTLAERNSGVPGTEAFTTGTLAEGVYVNQEMTAVGASAFSGIITITFQDVPPITSPVSLWGGDGANGERGVIGSFPEITFDGTFFAECCVISRNGIDYNNWAGNVSITYPTLKYDPASSFYNMTCAALSYSGIDWNSGGGFAPDDKYCFVVVPWDSDPGTVKIRPVGTASAIQNPEPTQMAQPVAPINMGIDGTESISVALGSDGSHRMSIYCPNSKMDQTILDMEALAFTFIEFTPGQKKIVDVFLANGVGFDYSTNLAPLLALSVFLWGGDGAGGERSSISPPGDAKYCNFIQINGMGIDPTFVTVGTKSALVSQEPQSLASVMHWGENIHAVLLNDPPPGGGGNITLLVFNSQLIMLTNELDLQGKTYFVINDVYTLNDGTYFINNAAIVAAGASLWGTDGAGGERLGVAGNPSVVYDNIADHYVATACVCILNGITYNEIVPISDVGYSQFLYYFDPVMYWIPVGKPSSPIFNEPMAVESGGIHFNITGENDIDIILVSFPDGLGGWLHLTILCSAPERATIISFAEGLGVVIDYIVPSAFIHHGMGTDYEFNTSAFSAAYWFDVIDAGQTQPVYDIWNENNEQVVPETIFPVRVAMGTFETDYAIEEDAVPGENWRLVGRGKISGTDTFVTVSFRVVEADVALEEAAMLVTLSETKQFLEIDFDSDDGFLLQLIGAASKAVETFCGTQFHVETQVSLISGEGRDTMHVTPGPIYELIKVERRESSGYQWTSVALQAFMYDGFFIQRIDGEEFDEGRRNWRITYKCGFDKADPQIRLAVKMLVKYWYNTKDRTAVLSDVVGGGLRVNYQETTDELPPSVKQILKPYRRLV